MTEILGIVRDGKIIPQELWMKFIGTLENDASDLEMNLERARRMVAAAVEEAFKKRMVPRFGILFSGGVDSTLLAYLAKKNSCDFMCYTVGIENSDDVAWARRIAAQYGFPLKFKVLTLEELEAVIRAVVKIIGEPDVTKVSVGAVFYAAAQIAIADGRTTVFSGLGSEEIFAGYQRHSDALGPSKKNYAALHKECWNGLGAMWERDLVRDFKIASTLGVKVCAPFLDKELIRIAMKIHPMYKVEPEHKKVILRYAAQSLGLAKEFAWRKKQAAQYGSDFVKGLDKLAAAKGFRYKKEYLQSLLLDAR